MTGSRALLRLAARDARRDRWRSLLVVVMVVLPVAGLVAGIGLLDTAAPTGPERAVGQVGAADAVAHPTGTSPVSPESEVGTAELLDDLAARIAPGTRLEPIIVGTDRLLRDTQRHPVTVSDERADPDALAAGRLELVEGRPPEAFSEVALTVELARVLEVAPGDEIVLEELGARHVSGLIRRPEALAAREVVVSAEAVPDGRLRAVLLAWPDDGPLPGIAIGEVVVDQGAWHAEAEWAFETRDWLAGQRLTGGERFAAIVIGGLVAVEVALVAGAAFAVSVRRRQRELGLLAAVGASRRQVRRAVLLTAVTTGLVGAATGALLGIGAVLASTPWHDALAGRVTGGPAIDPGWVALSMAIGLAAVLVGALWPARSVARLPVVVALSGRRPTPRPPRRVLMVGVVLGVVGVGVLLTATRDREPYVFLLGCVLVVLAAGCTSPWLLERFGALARHLPVGARLAVRDAARYRTRNGPIVTAAMAGLAASVTVATVLGSMAAEYRAHYQPQLLEGQMLIDGEPSVVQAAGRALARELDTPLVEVRRVGAMTTLEDHTGIRVVSAAVGTESLARSLGGQAAVDALANGQVVALGHDVDRVWIVADEAIRQSGGPVEIISPDNEVPVTGLPIRAGGGVDRLRVPTVLVPESALGGLTAALAADDPDAGTLLEPGGASSYLVDLGRPPSDDEVARARAVVEQVAMGAWLTVEQGFQDDTRLVRLAAVVVGLLAGTAIVAVAVALAAAESRADLATLSAVGASRRTRRALAAGRALLLAGLGGLLAVPVGLVPAVVVLTSLGEGVAVRPAWLTIAAVALGVPVVTMVGAVLTSRREGPLARAA